MSDPVAPVTLEEARERILSLYKRERERHPQLAAFINSGTTISQIEPGRITWSFFFGNHVAVFDRYPWLKTAFTEAIADEFGPQYSLILDCNPDAVNVHCFHAPPRDEAPPVPPQATHPVVPILASSHTESVVAPQRRRHRKSQAEDFDYKRYLASREWALLKEQVRERNGGWCEHCHAAQYQDTHHLTYERIGHEDLDDLLGLCRPCHEWVSGKTPQNPLGLSWIICEPIIIPRRSAAPTHIVQANHTDDQMAPGFRHEGALIYIPCGTPTQSPFGKCKWCEANPYNLDNFLPWLAGHGLA